MFSNNIIFKNFRANKLRNYNGIKKNLSSLFNEKNEILKSFSKSYKDSFCKSKIKQFKKFKIIKLIGIGGSLLGTKAIYSFLQCKFKKKKFIFLDNLNFDKAKINKKSLNLIISKSGNTLETIVNSNIHINKIDKNIFLTENKQSYLTLLANKLKSEIIHHNNFIGGRYSVLSEVGMLPAELMGFKSERFRQFNNLIKNKNFIKQLILNVNSILYLAKNKKYNSVIINYDQDSNDFFFWYQQLVAESLGKKKKGILPILSCMPKDNHSVMQLYLDGFKNNFYTFFYVKESKSLKINNNLLLPEKFFLKNKTIENLTMAQKIATENVFKKKNIPFRSFEIKIRNEQTLGQLFCFFMLETILIGRALKINPYDQPSVELIKSETNKILTN